MSEDKRYLGSKKLYSFFSPLTEKDAKWWLDNGHIYLQQYNILEIIVLIVLLNLFLKQADFIMQNYSLMNEWQLLGLAQFPLAIWAMLGTVWKSINTDLPTQPLKDNIVEE